MIYVCPICWKGFTLPVGDYMREKGVPCKWCGESSNKFIVGEVHHVEKPIVSTLYEVLD